jgi:hypothetical protein
MKMWKRYSAGLAILAGLTPGVWAQVTPAPIPTPTVPVAPAVVPAAPAAPTNNLWSFLCLSPQQKAACKAKLCASQFGQLLNNAMLPFGALTGGLIPPFCPPFNPANLGPNPASPEEGAAAKIAASEAGAKARAAAVRYLGTVDCYYWPEAQDALITALRTDTNECVRLEAAWALMRGCCCTKEVIVALSETVNGGKRAGGPPEKSERVKDAAAAALSHCLSCYPVVPLVPPSEALPEPKKPPEAPRTPAELPRSVTQTRADREFQLATFYKRVDAMTMEDAVARGRQALEESKKPAPTTAMRPAGRMKEQSLAALFARARGQTPTPETPNHDEMIQTLSPTAAPTKPVAATLEPPVAEDPGRQKGLINFHRTRPLPPSPWSNTPATPQAAAPAASAASPYAAVVAPAGSPHTAPPTTQVAALPAMPYAPPAPMPRPTITPVSYLTMPTEPVMTPPVEGAPAAKVQEWLNVLTQSNYPELRAFAASNLGKANLQTNPEVGAALLIAAQKDGVATVRVACIETLAKLRVQNGSVQATLQDLKADPDAQVRDAAYTALIRIAPAQ